MQRHPLIAAEMEKVKEKEGVKEEKEEEEEEEEEEEGRLGSPLLSLCPFLARSMTRGVGGVVWRAAVVRAMAALVTALTAPRAVAPAVARAVPQAVA